MARAAAPRLYDYLENEVEVTATQQAETDGERRQLVPNSNRTTRVSTQRTGRWQATPTRLSTRRFAVLLLVLLVTLLLLAGVVVVVGAMCKWSNRYTDKVVMAWNQPVPVFRQRGSYSGVDVMEEKSGSAAQTIELYVSRNFSEYTKNESISHQLTLCPQWYDILYAQYLLKGSTLSYNFSLPENKSLPLFVLNSFANYHELKANGHAPLLHHWVITRDTNSATFEVDEDSYIFVVVNVTANMTFSITSHESLQLYTPPASYLAPVCTLITYDPCHIKLSTHSTVIGVAVQGPESQVYPTVQTSSMKGAPVACVASLITLGVLWLSVLTGTLCTVLVYCCKQRV